MGRFTNTLEDQFVIIAGSGSARTEAQLKKALQDGPVTTCFSKKSVEAGERCSNGCSHANSIIGYTKNKWLLQESYGKHWGKNNDGSWQTTIGSPCSDAIIKKAYFPKVFYDYDRANAYYEATENGVNEADLKFVDEEVYGITAAHKRNLGTAKNKCAFLGSACKGVVKLSSGSFELVSDFGAGSSGYQAAFKKVQMVVYLKHEETGKYIGVEKNKEGVNLIAVTKDKAAPSFTSHSRFISFQYPRYHLVEDHMELIDGRVQDIDESKTWTLNNCNIYSDASGKSFDLLPGSKGKIFLGGSSHDPSSTSQKFNIGLSGRWQIISNELQLPLADRSDELQFTDHDKASYRAFRWNARQIINKMGRPYNHDMEISNAHFTFGNKENVMRPRDCGISRREPTGKDDHLTVKNNEVVMSSYMDSSWTFKYDDL